jgi:hypothetical protein
MNQRTLSKTEALQQLIICRQRLAEALHLFTLLDDLSMGRLTPSYDATEKQADYFETLRTAYFSWLASLIDKSRGAINVFDVWAALFPPEAARIGEVWNRNKHGFELLREFRNVTGFHGSNDLKDHIRIRSRVQGSDEVRKAAQEFFGLATDMVRLERQGSEFQNAVRAVCKECGIDPAPYLRRFEY